LGFISDLRAERFGKCIEHAVGDLFGFPGLATLHELARGDQELMVEFANPLGEAHVHARLALKEVLHI